MPMRNFDLKSLDFSRAIIPFILLTLVLTVCAEPQPNTVQPCPTPPSIVTGPNPLETFVAHSDVIVVGTVGAGQPELMAGRSFFRDWELDVEKSLTGQLSYDVLTIRTFTGAMDSAGNRMPVKSPNLAQDQRVLLFLDKDWDEPPLAGSEFTIEDLYGGAFRIRDGQINIRYFDESEEFPSKELDDVVHRIAGIVELCQKTGLN